MSIAQSLPEVDPFFIQKCPMCEKMNRMVVKGVYMDNGKRELYPDMGYSFCNCHAIFYTRLENLTEDYVLIPEGKDIIIKQPDPFFCDWQQDPYDWKHWNPRKYPILWDMHALVDFLPEVGIEVKDFYRDFDLQSPTLGYFIIKAIRNE